jgi:hypothetical protein
VTTVESAAAGGVVGVTDGLSATSLPEHPATTTKTQTQTARLRAATKRAQSKGIPITHATNRFATLITINLIGCWLVGADTNPHLPASSLEG